MLALGALGVLGGSSVGAEIRLREYAVPVGSVVRLGDIADLEGFTVRDAWQWQLVELVAAPAVNESRVLSADDIRQLLARSGRNAAGITLVGRQVEIRWQAPAVAAPASEFDAPAVQPVAPTSGFRTLGPVIAPVAPQVCLTGAQRAAIDDHLRDIVTRYIEDQTGKMGLIEVEVDMPLSDAEKLLQASGELTVSGGRAPWMGRLQLSLSMETEHGTLTLPLRVAIRDLTPVAVVVRACAKGEIMTASHVSMQPAPVESRLPPTAVPITDLAQLVGREAQRNLREGEVVTTALCLPPMMVRRGQLVTVAAAGGGIRIARQAVARTDGRQGEVVEVDVTGTKDRLSARVIAPGQLAITTGVAPVPPQATFDRTVKQPAARYAR